MQELLYAAKLSARRSALGMDAEPRADAPEGDEHAAEGAEAAILRGGLAALVAREAAQRLPGDMHLRRRLLQVAAEVPCGGTAAMREAICAEMRGACGAVRGARRTRGPCLPAAPVMRRFSKPSDSPC